jgi:hypothetical protein
VAVSSVSGRPRDEAGRFAESPGAAVTAVRREALRDAPLDGADDVGWLLVKQGRNWCHDTVDELRELEATPSEVADAARSEVDELDYLKMRSSDVDHRRTMEAMRTGLEGAHQYLELRGAKFEDHATIMEVLRSGMYWIVYVRGRQTFGCDHESLVAAGRAGIGDSQYLVAVGRGAIHEQIMIVAAREDLAQFNERVLRGEAWWPDPG